MTLKKEYTHQELATKRRKLALEYKAKMVELAEIKKKKAIKIIAIMGQDHIKSQKHAELLYSATDDGQKEIEITFYCRGLLELMRSIKSEIDIKNSEAYNQY